MFGNKTRSTSSTPTTLRWQFAPSDALYSFERCCRALTRPQEIAGPRLVDDDQEVTFQRSVVVDAYRATCTLINLVNRENVQQRLSQEPAVFTRRWPSIRYWFTFITTRFNQDDYNIDEIPVVHHELGPTAVVCRLVNALQESDVDEFKPLFRDDVQFVRLVVRLWLGQEALVRSGRPSQAGPTSNNKDHAHNLTEWAQGYTRYPSAVLGSILASGGAALNMVTVHNVRILLKCADDNIDLMALAAVHPLRKTVRVFRTAKKLSSDGVRSNASWKSLARTEDLRTYIYLICMFVSVDFDAKIKLATAFARLNLHITLAKALEELVTIASGLKMHADPFELYDLDMSMGMAIHVTIRLLLTTGTTLARSLADTGIIKSISDLFDVMQDRVRRLDILPHGYVTSSEQGQNLLLGILPRYFHFSGLTKMFFKSAVSKGLVASFVTPVMGKQRRDVELFGCYTIERAVCQMILSRKIFNTKYRCHNCNALFMQKPLRRCSGCKFRRYCSSKCLALAWNYGGHKAECQQMRQRRNELGRVNNTGSMVNEMANMDLRHCLPGLYSYAQKHYPNEPFASLNIVINYARLRQAPEMEPWAGIRDLQHYVMPSFAMLTPDELHKAVTPGEHFYKLRKMLEDWPGKSYVMSEYLNERFIEDDVGEERTKPEDVSDDVSRIESITMLIDAERAYHEHKNHLIHDSKIVQNRAAYGIVRPPKYVTNGFGLKPILLETVQWDDVDDLWARAVTNIRDERTTSMWKALQIAVEQKEFLRGEYDRLTPS